MVQQKRENCSCLQLDKQTVKELYKHVDMLSDTKYRFSLEGIKNKCVSYESEDFVQDNVEHIVNVFGSKAFPTLSKFKAFINTSVGFVHSHKIREHFATKLRKDVYEQSLDAEAFENRTLGEITPAKQFDADSSLVLSNLMSKNLYVLYTNGTYEVGTLKELKRRLRTNSTLLSVNFFLEKQIEYGQRDTVAYYKNKGFYMTYSVFENMSQAIIDYARQNDLLLDIDTEEPKRYDRYRTSKYDVDLEQRRLKVATCSCGYVNHSYKLEEPFWQCEICGKIHSRDGILFDEHYEPQTTKSDILYVKDVLNSKYITNPLKV